MRGQTHAAPLGSLSPCDVGAAMTISSDGLEEGEVFDRKESLSKVDGDLKLLQELAQLFLEHCDALTAALEEAIRLNNGGLNVDVGNSIGQDYTVGVTYKPLIVDNVQLTWGGSVFFQGNAMQALTQTDDTLYSTFLAAVLIY